MPVSRTAGKGKQKCFCFDFFKTKEMALLRAILSIITLLIFPGFNYHFHFARHANLKLSLLANPKQSESATPPPNYRAVVALPTDNRAQIASFKMFHMPSLSLLSQTPQPNLHRFISIFLY
jgi:hypothetical protein